MSKDKKVLALILARGGSKGVPGKNVKILGKKPLITHTIDAVLKTEAAEYVDRIVLSTDSPEIAKVAKKAGAEVPFLRPPELASDTASSLGAMKHALSWLKSEQGYVPDSLLLLQPTSPFRQGWQICEAIEKFNSSGKTSLLGVKEIQEGHPLWTVDDTSDESLNWYIETDDRPNRRQDLPKVFTINGGMYITKTSYFEDVEDPMPAYDAKDACIYPMNQVTSVDINEPLDFCLAETLIKQVDFSLWVREPKAKTSRIDERCA